MLSRCPTHVHTTLPGAGGTVGGAADEPLPMDDMIEDAVLAAGGEMDDTPGDDEEFMPVGMLF